MPQSSVQISGRQAATWAMRSVAPAMSDPAPKGSGVSVGPNTMSPPIPAVRFSTTSTSAARIRSVTSRYRSNRREGLPLSGSRTWQWTMAAPARAASIALAAICTGERGTCGLRPCVPPDPVTAQVMNTSRFICNGMVAPRCGNRGARFCTTAQARTRRLGIRERHQARATRVCSRFRQALTSL